MWRNADLGNTYMEQLNPALVKNREFATILVDEFRGPSAAARACGVQPPSVIGWKRRGITSVRCDSIRVRAPAEWARAVQEFELREEYRRSVAMR